MSRQIKKTEHRTSTGNGRRNDDDATTEPAPRHFDRFDSGLLRSIGLKLSGDQIHILLTNMDSDRNGSIEFDELVAAIFDDIDEQTTYQDHMLVIFQSFSIGDGNDVITKVELAAAMG
ncbi:Probable calcium-binding protein CML15 [Linum perenne]